MAGIKFESPACNLRDGCFCFAHSFGKCRILATAYPKGKACPFYKTVRQFNRERECFPLREQEYRCAPHNEP